MQPNPTSAPQSSHFLTPTLAVGVTFVVTVALLGGTAIYQIQGAPVALRFFDPRRSPTFDETCVVAAMDYALSSSEHNDVIFIGDSSCRTGVDPVAFERRTGLHAYNLGIVGDLGPSVMLNVAKAYLAQHPRPKVVVVCLSPIGLERDVPWYWVKLHNHVVNCFGYDAHNLSTVGASLGYTLRQGTVLGWDRSASRFTGRPDDVRDLPLIGLEKVTYRQFEDLARQKRGHFELSGHGPPKKLDRPGGVVRVHEVWGAGLRRLCRSCDRAGVPLMFRFCPVSAEATRNLKFDEVERWLRALRADCPRLLVVQEQNIVRYAPDLCWDYSHPNVEGTRVFTERLAGEVHSALDRVSLAQGQ
jgi:hypothetical protein